MMCILELVVINLHIKFEVGILIFKVHPQQMQCRTVPVAYMWHKSTHSHRICCHMCCIALWCHIDVATCVTMYGTGTIWCHASMHVHVTTMQCSGSGMKKNSILFKDMTKAPDF